MSVGTNKQGHQMEYRLYMMKDKKDSQKYDLKLSNNNSEIMYDDCKIKIDVKKSPEHKGKDNYQWYEDVTIKLHKETCEKRS